MSNKQKNHLLLIDFGLKCDHLSPDRLLSNFSLTMGMSRGQILAGSVISAHTQFS